MTPTSLACLVSLLLSAGGDAPLVAVPEKAGLAVIVFVADGSGDQTYASDGLSCAVKECAPGVCVERVSWSRTHLGVVDLHDKAGREAAACQLAGRVTAARACNPCVRICFVGHSAGAHLVLEAAGKLPCGGVDRVILLAAAVSKGYDLGPAQCGSREGIDSFYSKKDCTLLGVEAACLTADGRKGLTAGRVGFSLGAACSDGSKLREYPYDASMKKQGHNGGHYGWTKCEFLKAHVVPLLLGGPVGCPASHP